MKQRRLINGGKPFTQLRISSGQVSAQQAADTGGDYLYQIPGTYVTMALPTRVHGWTDTGALRWWIDRAAARSRRLLQDAADGAPA